jgi:hypothetical protein
MTSTALTIDNLGIGPSNAFEERSRQDVSTFISDATAIAARTNYAIDRPVMTGHTDELFEMTRARRPWALITPPPRYSVRSNTLFTETLSPRIGSTERLDLLQSRIDRVQEQSNSDEKEGSALKWEAQKRRDEVQTETDHLSAFVAKMQDLTSMLELANGERTRFCKV